jgi:hypothetical protein
VFPRGPSPEPPHALAALCAHPVEPRAAADALAALAAGVDRVATRAPGEDVAAAVAAEPLAAPTAAERLSHATV